MRPRCAIGRYTDKRLIVGPFRASSSSSPLPRSFRRPRVLRHSYHYFRLSNPAISPIDIVEPSQSLRGLDPPESPLATTRCPPSFRRSVTNNQKSHTDLGDAIYQLSVALRDNACQYSDAGLLITIRTPRFQNRYRPPVRQNLHEQQPSKDDFDDWRRLTSSYLPGV